MSPAGNIPARSKSKNAPGTPSKPKASTSTPTPGNVKAKTRTKSSPARGSASPLASTSKEEAYAGIGSAAVAAKTGRGWHDWFSVLDGAKASAWPHKQIASFLHDEHSVPGWWSQMITVGYEQARGLRVKHEKADGFAASASKTIDAPVEILFDAWSVESTRRSWLGSPALTIRKATRPKSMRITWGDGSSVLVNFSKKGADQSLVAVEHEKLGKAADVGRMKRAWATALDKLKTKLERT